MSHRPFKTRLYAEFARVGSARASEKLLDLLDLLAQGPRHAEAQAAEMEMSVANASQHLQVLRHARLIEAEREGTTVRYRLGGADVLRLWLALRSVAETRLADVGQVVRDFGVLSPEAPFVSRDELAERVARGEVVVIDVRPPVEYAHGHLPGALPIPVEALPDRLDELPRDRPIVADCRGAYCLFADEAVALLREHGFDAVRLDGGWPEWWAEGRAVATGASGAGTV